MRFGRFNLYSVSDGRYRLDGAGMFGLMPKVEWQQIASPDEQNRIAVELRCLLIETETQKIVVDTGYGDKLSAKDRALMDLEGDGRLLGSLAAVGVQPDEIDIVINTHLHGDHCGGNTRYDAQGDLVATFPRAVHYVQRIELADATFPNERTTGTYHRENFEPLQQSGQLRVLSGSTRVVDGVRVLATPGHTPGHQSVVIESEGRPAVYLADLAHWPFHIEQMDHLTAFDVLPLVTMETKRDLARWAVERGALLLFDHHPEVKAGILHATDTPDRYRLEPVEL